MTRREEEWSPLGTRARITWREILALLVAALLIRTYKGLVTPVIAEDGVVYLEQAALFRSGEIAEALRGHYPPLYPASIALVETILPDPVAAGKAVSVAFGTLALIPLVILGQAIFPARAVRAAAVIYCLSPFLLTFAGDVLTESLFVFLVLSALAGLWKAGTTGRVLPAIVAALSVGLACVTRPEGVLLIPFGLAALWVLRSPRGQGRATLAAAILFGTICLAPIVPYAIFLRSETGHVQFSRKGPELLGGLIRYARQRKVDLAGYPPPRGAGEITIPDALGVIHQNRGLYLRKYLRDFSLLAVKSFPHAIHPIGLCLFLSGLLLRRPRGRSEWCLVGFLVWYLVCVSANYANPRFVVAMVAPALLWTGVGCEEIRRRLERRWTGSPHRVAWVLMGALAAGLAARALQPERRDKLWMLAAAREIRASTKHPRVCSRWRRLAFYAGGEHVPMPRRGEFPLLRHSRKIGVTHLALRRNEGTEWFFRKEGTSRLTPVFTAGTVFVFEIDSPPR